MMDMSYSNLETKNHCTHPVKVQTDLGRYNDWCIEHLKYDWYKKFGIMSAGSTYYFPSGEDALAFKIWAGV
jgi:hypothetical protein